MGGRGAKTEPDGACAKSVTEAAASYVLSACFIWEVLEKPASLCNNRAIESGEFRAGDMH